MQLLATYTQDADRNTVVFHEVETNALVQTLWAERRACSEATFVKEAQAWARENGHQIVEHGAPREEDGL